MIYQNEPINIGEEILESYVLSDFKIIGDSCIFRKVILSVLELLFKLKQNTLRVQQHMFLMAT